MKLVEFTRDVRPYRAGDAYALPDHVAEEVVAAGDGKVVASVFDRKKADPEPPRQRYHTRKAK